MRSLSAGLTLVMATCLPLVVDAQPPSSGAPQPPERPTSQMPDLGRPTTPEDQVPVLDFERYFTGTWTFSWDYPDSALGPAGGLIGSTEFTALGDGYFEATTEASGEAGTVTIRETFGYSQDDHTIARMVQDSRGYSYLQTGTVAGDLGGVFTIRLDGAPFLHNGQTIRVRSTVRLLSPFNYRVQTSVSEDGDPFLNHGNPWWEKDVPRSERSSEGPSLDLRSSPAASGRPPTSPAKVDVVAVTGCVVEAERGIWTLAAATDPVPSIANGPPATQVPDGPTVGDGEFHLIGVSEFDLPSLRDQTVLVKALLITDSPLSRLNLTSVTTVAPSCPPGGP